MRKEEENVFRRGAGVRFQLSTTLPEQTRLRFLSVSDDSASPTGLEFPKIK